MFINIIGAVLFIAFAIFVFFFSTNWLSVPAKWFARIGSIALAAFSVWYLVIQK